METRVAFRKFPTEANDAADVIALFIDEPWDTSGNIASYQTIGQHGGASPDLVIDLNIATKEDYTPLQTELENLGYSLQIV